MGNISVTVSTEDIVIASPTKRGLGGASTSWGAVYWQYFEDLDKITFAATPLKLSKKLFIENKLL